MGFVPTSLRCRQPKAVDYGDQMLSFRGKYPCQLGVGGVFLLLPFGHIDPGVEWGSLVMYSLIGVPGAAAGFSVAWSVHRGRSLLWGIAALAFAAAHILLLVRVFLSVAGVGHLYAPTALMLLALSIWNLVLIVRPPRWTW